MKRQRSDIFPKRTGDIRKDLTESQLASLGAVALAYNEAEAFIDTIMVFGLGVAAEVAAEVTSRINGVDGKIEIAKAAMKELGATGDTQAIFADSLGKGGFMKLKEYRDAVIHARTLDAPTGIAGTAAKRGKFYEVLLTKEALDGLYDRLVLVRCELMEACNIAINLSGLRKIEQFEHQAGAVLPQAVPVLARTKAKLEQDIQAALSRHRGYQHRRLSLAPLPKFPSESELQQVHLQWLKDRQAERTGWYLAFPEPLVAPRLNPGDIQLQVIPPRQPEET
jgi:hypothetical protein